MTIPLELHVTRYKCPHCPKSYSKKPTTIEHIGRCWLNPSARSCKTCEHRVEPDYDYGANSPEDCSVGVELPLHPRNNGNPEFRTLPVHCPKWEPAVSRECGKDVHDECPRFTWSSDTGFCYCPCHAEENQP